MLQFFARRLNELHKVEGDERGFTLIELLIVILILMILAAIAIPYYLAQQRKAEIATCTSDARNAAAAANLYRAQTGGYTGITVAGGTSTQLTDQGWRSSDTATTDYSLSLTGTPTKDQIVLNVSCNGTGLATFDASTGKVVPPSA